MTATHADLVSAAAKWLQKKCPVVITELATIGEEPDAIGWRGTYSILVECKAGMSDFYADRQKPFRADPSRGIGHQRFFLTPAGLVTPDKLPENWGLLEYDGKRVKQVRESGYFEAANARHEIGILLSTLRRVGLAATHGVSIKHYTFPTRNRATLGLEVEE